MSDEYKGQIAEAPAAESWKSWLGKTVNGKFPLREYLGGVAHRAVFLTEYDNQPAAIHLVSENFPDRARQLEAWQLAAETSHVNLTRVFQVGLCQIENEELFYAVMEFAEENLGQILTERPLSAEETSEMLKPALDALAYLHKRGLAHGALNPANIGARGDQLKLSCGDLCRTGEAIRVAGKYDAPEGVCSPAADMWSLGISIVEVLTQRLPRQDRKEGGDAEVPKDLQAPFLEAARNCLRLERERRWTAEEVSDHLSGKVRTQTALIPSASSTAAELKKTAAKSASVARMPEPTHTKAHLREQRVARVAPTIALRNQAPKKTRTLVYTVTFVIVASFIAIKLITRAPGPPAETAQPAATSVAAEPPAEAPAQAQKGVNPSPGADATLTASKKPGNETPATSAPQAEIADAGSPPTEGIAPSHAGHPERKLDQEQTAAGAVHQVIPDVLQSAQRSIRGTVRVAIKVRVDESGNVTDAAIDSPGPSRYFANAALQAARQWKFGTRADDARDWLVRFDFTTNGATASAKALEK